MSIQRLPRASGPSKYLDLHKAIGKLSKNGQYALWYYNGTDIKQERQRIASNVRYHCRPPEGFKFKFRCVISDAGHRAIAVYLVEV